MCSNQSTRSLGSRRAEEQEVLVQDVEVDLTGPADAMGLRARHGLFVTARGDKRAGGCGACACRLLVLSSGALHLIRIVLERNRVANLESGSQWIAGCL